MGLKQGAMGNTLGAQIGNKGKMKKYPPPRPHLLQKEKTRAHHECMLSLPIGCMKFLFPKLLVTIFGPG
jgi:hypothetical protein